MIESLSKRKHLNLNLQMIQKDRTSSKPLLKTLLSVTHENTQTAFGRNLRHIMLFTDKTSVTEIDANSLEEKDEKWKVEMVECVLEGREHRPQNRGPFTQFQKSQAYQRLQQFF